MKNDYEFDFGTVWKLGQWASNLPDDIDFIDYWYNLFLSATKKRIDKNIVNKINAFHWTRWQEDFEEFVDKYKPLRGDGFGADARDWYGMYMQYLVYAFKLPGEDIARFYGKDVFAHVMNGWTRYHTYGVDLFVETIVSRYGCPIEAERIILLGI